MTSESRQAFLSLVRLGIGHGRDLPNIIDWQSLHDLANMQGLGAIIVDGIEQLKIKSEELKVDISLPPKSVMLQLIGVVLQNYEQRYKLYRRAIAELAGFYNSHGFKMMVLKGYACSQDWPKPGHRPSGDIDIWLFGQQKEADALLAKEKGIKVDASHHHHTVFKWHSVTVENHYDFINVHARRSNAKLERIFKELGNIRHTDDSDKGSIRSKLIKNYNQNRPLSEITHGMKIPCVELYGERVYLPSADLHALFLIRHAAAHFAAAKITLRQVLDWAFFVEKHGNEVDWSWLASVLEEFGMKQFFDVLNAICMEDLGFVFSHTDITENTEVAVVDSRQKDRVLNDILEPEFREDEPSRLLPRAWFRYRRWQANSWKQQLCYNESRWSVFWSGVWNHLLKPSSI